MLEKHLYLQLYPNYSLIASQLDPAGFAKHYAQGSTSFLGGNFLFAAVDPDFRNDYFKIDAAYAELKHEDNRPKATKFISNYRTLEHMDFAALGNLYYCNSFGDYVELEPGKHDPATISEDELRIFLDINPTKMVALTRHDFIEHGRFITDPASFIGVPTALYTQVNFYIDDFMAEFESNPFLNISIPGTHPARLRNAIMEISSPPHKVNKGLSLNCPLDKISYKDLRHGFMFASKEKNKYYPLIPLYAVERDFFKFWKSL